MWVPGAVSWQPWRGGVRGDGAVQRWRAHRAAAVRAGPVGGRQPEGHRARARRPIAPAITLGAVTGAGGGTIRDVLVRRVPTVLTSGLYAIPALAVTAVTTVRTGVYGTPAAAAALACFPIRTAGIRYNLNAPVAREAKNQK